LTAYISPKILIVPSLGMIIYQQVRPHNGGQATADGQDADEGYPGGPKEREQLC